MPTSEAPAEVNEPKGPAEPSPQRAALRRKPLSRARSWVWTPSPRATSSRARARLEPLQNGAPAPAVRGSRWVDYDTHELLEMISELEDERRWARLREGFCGRCWSTSCCSSRLHLIPRYILKWRPIIDDFEQHQETKRRFRPIPTRSPICRSPRPLKPLLNKPLIDKQTMDEMKRRRRQRLRRPRRSSSRSSRAGAAQAAARAADSAQPAVAIAGRGAAPAGRSGKPNFAMGSQNPADQLRQDMQQRHAQPRRAELGNQAPRRIAEASRRRHRRRPESSLTRRASTSTPGWRAGTTSRSAPGTR